MNLKPGRCYLVAVAAVDEDGNYAEVVSPWIRILDLTPPRIISRTPAAGADHVRRKANVKVRFSEPVVVRATDVRLRNARTGNIVKATYTWNRDTNTVTLDPAHRLRADTRYRIDVGSGIVDRGGNHLNPVHWGFVTGS
jgi:hypothetical protein